ncbi:MAG TPA: molybdenum cofactor guanylyltransferase [Bacteroidia bacterium]|nr:molybdenum cofactor guanylyltransferase [Bacteroidia bacterium]
MSSRKKNITGFILAGGNSSRMGEEKGVMLLNGKSMVEHEIEKLKPCVDNLILIANSDAYMHFNIPVVSDKIKNTGPAGGIFTGLSISETERNFFISCDMPFITGKIILKIISRSVETEITVPVVNHRIEPLCGVYSKSCLEKWELLINAGTIKLREIIMHFSSKFVELKEDIFSAHQHFANINTKIQFEEAIKISETWK